VDKELNYFSGECDIYTEADSLYRHWVAISKPVKLSIVANKPYPAELTIPIQLEQPLSNNHHHHHHHYHHRSTWSWRPRAGPGIGPGAGALELNSRCAMLLFIDALIFDIACLCLTIGSMNIMAYGGFEDTLGCRDGRLEGI
jgi:hypothetical protein